MNEGFLFLFRGHLGGFAGIEADENNFVVAPGIEGEHAERADDTLLDLIAQHGAAVVDEREDHRLLVSEIVAELNAAAGFVAEREVHRHWPVERRLESHVLQSPRHSGSRWADVGGDSLRAQKPRPQQKRWNPDDMANFFHFLFFFFPPPLPAP